MISHGHSVILKGKMALITKSFGRGKEYLIDKGGLTHSQAKIRAKKLRSKGFMARISPYEGKWATWIKRIR